MYDQGIVLNKNCSKNAVIQIFNCYKTGQEREAVKKCSIYKEVLFYQRSGKKGERMELKAPVILPSAALSSQRHKDSGGKEKVDFYLSFSNHRQPGDLKIPGCNKRVSDVQTLI